MQVLGRVGEVRGRPPASGFRYLWSSALVHALPLRVCNFRILESLDMR